MGSANKDDRRKYARVGFTTRVEIILEAGGKRRVLDAESRDLNQTGVFAGTDEIFALDTPCTVNIYLSGGQNELSLEIRGRVVRQVDTGIGIVFESMDVDAYTHLKNIVRYNHDAN